jgi:GAF domain-containing protein
MRLPGMERERRELVQLLNDLAEDAVERRLLLQEQYERRIRLMEQTIERMRNENRELAKSLPNPDTSGRRLAPGTPPGNQPDCPSRER